MEVNVEYLKRAIAGDRMALFNAFSWGDSPQGEDYWVDQYRGDNPLDIAALRAMLPKERMEAGKKYQTSRHGEFECISVFDDIAYCVRSKGRTAYTWDANTGKSLRLGEEWDIDLTPKPVVETRKGLVVFTDGVADWDSWTEVE